MNPRNLYLGIAGGITAVLLVIGGMMVWRRRTQVQEDLKQGSANVKRFARSWWGSAKRVAEDLGHTERDPQIH